MIILSNSLKRSKETFIPLDEKNVRLYACGPTVYDRAHIGNARAVVIFDVLFRTLRHAYGENNVKYVRNITDVDDKINAASKERNVPISEITEKTTKMFHDDMASLGCLNPTHEPRATAHIPEMLDMIERLIKNGNAYAAEGHVLFRVKSDKNYGVLSGRSVEEMIAGARVEIAPYKEDPMDFVLWKPSSDDEPGWDSKWGRGRPGWHIECSAMSIKYLGETFDIHAGGADLQFPHHENEIAQSCCAYPGSHFAKMWVHNGFLTVEGEKMSKSLGNFITVHDLLDKGVKGEVVRYALLATHYKKPLDWTAKAVLDAEKSMDSIYKAFEYSNGNGDISSEIIEALRDDLNTPKAFAVLHKLASDVNRAHESEKSIFANILKASANLLGLGFKSADAWFNSGDKSIENKEYIENMVEKRGKARLAKNWAESDRIRDELAKLGVIIEDKPDGTATWRMK